MGDIGSVNSKLIFIRLYFVPTGRELSQLTS